DEEARRHHAEQKANLTFLIGRWLAGDAEQVLNGRASDHRKQPHLGPVEHPAEQRRRERHPLSAIDAARTGPERGAIHSIRRYIRLLSVRHDADIPVSNSSVRTPT